ELGEHLDVESEPLGDSLDACEGAGARNIGVVGRWRDVRPAHALAGAPDAALDLETPIRIEGIERQALERDGHFDGVTIGLPARVSGPDRVPGGDVARI